VKKHPKPLGWTEPLAREGAVAGLVLQRQGSDVEGSMTALSP
jgi:hypothetical protein